MAENYSFRSAVNGFHRGDVLACLEKLLNENTSLREEAAELEELVAAREAEIEALKEQLDKAEKKHTDGDRVDTALLGAAMYDARRFSDLIVNEAKDTAGAIFDQTAGFAQDASGRTNDLAASVSALAGRIRETLSDVENGMVALGVELETFRASATEDKADFLKRFNERTSEKFERETAEKREG